MELKPELLLIPIQNVQYFAPDSLFPSAKIEVNLLLML